jgi:hypothetical protein
MPSASAIDQVLKNPSVIISDEISGIQILIGCPKRAKAVPVLLYMF